MLSSVSITMADESGRIVSAYPSSFQGGVATTVIVTVQNTGDSDDMIIECASKPLGWTVLPSSREISMSPGSYYSAQFSVIAPVSGGSGIIVWKLYAEGNFFDELLDTYNQNVTATPGQDLFVEDIGLTPTQVYLGPTTFQRTVRVKNIGSASSGPCHLRIQTSGVLSEIKTVSIPSLSPGQSYTYEDQLQATFLFPSNYSVSIIAQIDCYDEVHELNENNNIREESFPIVISGIRVLEPNGGEELPVDSNSVVQWQTYGTIPTVNLEVSIDGGTTWEILESELTNTGQYEWTVTEYWASPTCLLRVLDASNTSIYDESDSTFQIFVCTLKYDLDGNCIVDFKDFALLISEWLKSGNPYNEI